MSGFVYIACGAVAAAVELFACMKVCLLVRSFSSISILQFNFWNLSIFQIDLMPAIFLVVMFLGQIVASCAFGAIIGLCVR